MKGTSSYRNLQKGNYANEQSTLSHIYFLVMPNIIYVQVNLDMTDTMGPGKLVCHMQNLSYTYDEYLICIGLGPSISSVICKNLSYRRTVVCHIQIHLYICYNILATIVVHDSDKQQHRHSNTCKCEMESK